MRFRSDPASTIRGSIAPVVTPFTAEGELDLDGLGDAAKQKVMALLRAGSPVLNDPVSKLAPQV